MTSKNLENMIQKTELIKPLLPETNPAEATSAQLSQLTPKILDHIMAVMAPQLEQLSSTFNLLSHSLEEVVKTRQKIDERVDLDRDINAAADQITNATDIYSAIEDCHTSINLLIPSLELTQEYIHSLSMQLLTQPNPSPPTASKLPLFSKITTAYTIDPMIRLHTSCSSPPNFQVFAHQTHLPPNTASRTHHQIPPIDEALARATLRARQILLDPIPGNLVFPLDISHEDTLSKIHTTIQTTLTQQP
ncbi:uncharacterized protein EDB91DRAFT_1255165 [Suillus paluster]|uniref:uncharacterized protein n=1 Tax=Suillus paluster TaxID=48578 RepID=UPI001B861AE7|nr:uncharacterized protein EDB91DRAFT_1255165 [Suillus paluster]KAG1724572.1 hypothetical protein EDB91DRAFT_1255165 [Suillus paluster]